MAGRATSTNSEICKPANIQPANAAANIVQRWALESASELRSAEVCESDDMRTGLLAGEGGNGFTGLAEADYRACNCC